MSNAPATRYSDRDVRENTELFDIAARYLQSYHGDFEYLLDVQRYYTVHGSLSVAMTRGVLNCMRNDPRVAGDLPAPKHFSEDEEDEGGNVVSIKKKRKKKRTSHQKHENPESCGNPESHDQHYWGGEYQFDEWCEGVPWSINREFSYHLPLVVKVPYVLARGGSMIHGVNPDNHWVSWFPNLHEWGFRVDYDGIIRTDLHIKLLCKYPSVLKNPRLLTEPQAFQVQDDFQIPLCRHCFPKESSAPQE